MHTTAVVTVEVHLVSENLIPVTAMRPIVEQWLRSDYKDRVLRIQQEIDDFDGLSYSENIETIYIASIIDENGENRTKLFCLPQVELRIICLTFSDHPPFQSITFENPDNQLIHLSVTRLPHKSFHGLCESLIYEDNVQARLTQFVSRMVRITRRPHINRHLINWNGLVLLHGPSGTGKTTLCRGIAYKLSILMREMFSDFRLIELYAASMFSSYFGESAAIIENTFASAFTLTEDPSAFIIILVDEVESIAGSRERSLGTNEVADAARAMNQVLIALDKMRRIPNILMLCTSNLLNAVDAAFLDRVDHKQYVPIPSIGATHEILRSSLDELIKSGIITASTEELLQLDEAKRRAIRIEDIENLKLRSECNGCELTKLAKLCLGRSGRTLRRLAHVSLALYSPTDDYTLPGAIKAMEKAVTKDESET